MIVYDIEVENISKVDYVVNELETLAVKTGDVNNMYQIAINILLNYYNKNNMIENITLKGLYKELLKTTVKEDYVTVNNTIINILYDYFQ